MEEGQKKVFKIIIVVVCLVAAGTIYKMTSGGSSGLGHFKGQLMWVKCNNPDCGDEYQMDKKDYFEQKQKNWDPRAPLSDPAIKCTKCGEMSVYRAEKCPKCGTVFFYGFGEGFPDKCPECGYSAMELNSVKKKSKSEAK
ncbi:MAG: hypothetical protein JXB29_07420 [Sedimentisphaerales bacterium]|nr:hypothetical protein [Sedimentisphaerales bacterium]